MMMKDCVKSCSEDDEEFSVFPDVLKIIPTTEPYRKYVCRLCRKYFAISHKLKHHSLHYIRVKKRCMNVKNAMQL